MKLIDPQTISHFDQIAKTWEQKGWVNSLYLNRRIAHFVRRTERRLNLHQKRLKTSAYFGIGTGALFRYFSRYNLAGIDQAGEMLGQCPEGVIQILSNVEDLPFLSDNQFHLTFSRNLLKHCPEPLAAIRSMYHKTRPGHVAIAIESVILDAHDRVIPTALVRLTDPSHPAFLTVEEIIHLFKQVGFREVDFRVVPFRAAWLKQWLIAEQASSEVHQAVLGLYKHAPQSFKDRHQVVIEDGEITSTVPWLMVRAIK